VGIAVLGFYLRLITCGAFSDPRSRNFAIPDEARIPGAKRLPQPAALLDDVSQQSSASVDSAANGTDRRFLDFSDFGIRHLFEVAHHDRGSINLGEFIQRRMQPVPRRERMERPFQPLLQFRLVRPSVS